MISGVKHHEAIDYDHCQTKLTSVIGEPNSERKRRVGSSEKTRRLHAFDPTTGRIPISPV